MLESFVLNLFALLPFAVIAVATAYMFAEAQTESEPSVTKARAAFVKRTPALLGTTVAVAAVASVVIAFADGGASIGTALTSLIA